MKTLCRKGIKGRSYCLFLEKRNSSLDGFQLAQAGIHVGLSSKPRGAKRTLEKQGKPRAQALGNNKSMAPTCANPGDILKPLELGGTGHPWEECGHFTEALERTRPNSLPPSPPHCSFWSLPQPPAEGGKNKCAVHRGNCRPLCRLSILALLKFRVACSRADKSSIRFLFRTCKAHAEPDGSTARFIALGPGKALPPDDLLPQFFSS